MKLQRLFEPIKIRNLTIKNRIFSSGHQTVLVDDGVPNEALTAYHLARAIGGAGLIVTEIAAIHETAFFSSHTIRAYEDACIPGYRRLASAIHQYNCAIVAQLFHPGREVYGVLPDGRRPIAYAPSAAPAERYLISPRPMTTEMCREIVKAYASAARRVCDAGLDGVEIVASHGYLPAQFLNPRVNLRQDQYGGSSINRVRFLREILSAVRAAVGDQVVVGLRISADEECEEGLCEGEVLTALKVLDSEKLIDYANIIVGSSSSSKGAIHIVPPMRIEAGYVAPMAARVKAAVSVPVLVAGRINQPQIAEAILANGQADMCGMTRAMICDPEFANKARDGRLDDIKACIACNQACIGHMQIDVPISCIQTPETGRELTFSNLGRTPRAKTIVVVGGGPAGMKAAAVAAQRGHRVTLFEAESSLGGQAKLAQLLPGRTEFGGLITNLAHELEAAEVKVFTGRSIQACKLAELGPDIVILATGARPRRISHDPESTEPIEAWDLLLDRKKAGSRVAIADWRGDWIGFGLAERLARAGHYVRYFTSGSIAGASLQSYLRDQWIGELAKLGVELKTHHRFFGHQDGVALFQHTATDLPVEVADIDTVVTSLGHESVDELEHELIGLKARVVSIGDCVAPRTAEEAIYEGLELAYTL